MTLAGERLDPPQRYPHNGVVMPPSAFDISIHGPAPEARFSMQLLTTNPGVPAYSRIDIAHKTLDGG
jgi:hypothetical protein